MAFGVYGCGQYKMIDVDGALMMITVCFGVVYSSAPPAGGVFSHLVLITVSVVVLLRNNDHTEMAGKQPSIIRHADERRRGAHNQRD